MIPEPHRVFLKSRVPRGGPFLGLTEGAREKLGPEPPRKKIGPAGPPSFGGPLVCSFRGVCPGGLNRLKNPGPKIPTGRVRLIPQIKGISPPGNFSPPLGQPNGKREVGPPGCGFFAPKGPIPPGFPPPPLDFALPPGPARVLNLCPQGSPPVNLARFEMGPAVLLIWA